MEEPRGLIALTGIAGTAVRPAGPRAAIVPVQEVRKTRNCSVARCRVLPEPLAEGFTMQGDTLLGIAKASLAAELIHVDCNEFAVRAHVLCEQLVSERPHAHPAVVSQRTQTFGEVDQRTR